jgi:transposase
VARIRRTEDPKVAALRETRCLNPHPEAVTDERFTSSDFFDARDLAQVKYEMVRAVREEQMPVTVAAAGFGLSRQSYYHTAAALDEGGLPALAPAKPGPKGGHKLTEEVCAFAEDALAADPSLRATDLCGAIERAFGVRVHARSIERALARRRGRRSKSG